MRNKRFRVDFEEEGKLGRIHDSSASFSALTRSVISILPPPANVRFQRVCPPPNRLGAYPQHSSLPGSARFQRAFSKASYVKGADLGYHLGIHDSPGSRRSTSAQTPSKILALNLGVILTSTPANAVHTLHNSVNSDAEARVPNFAAAVAKPLINNGAATPVSSDSTPHVSSYGVGYRLTFPTTVSNPCTE